MLLNTPGHTAGILNTGDIRESSQQTESLPGLRKDDVQESESGYHQQK